MSLEVAFELGRFYPLIKKMSDGVVDAHEVFERLPGLEAYWQTGLLTQGTAVTPTIGTGFFDLSRISNPVISFGETRAYCQFSGSNYLSGSNAGANPGNETWIEASIRGFTAGCWVRLQEATVAPGDGIMGRTGNAPNFGWWLAANPGGTAQGVVSTNGTAAEAVSMLSALTVGQWHFVALRFSNATDLSLFVDGAKVSQSTALTSIFTPSQAFEVGRIIANNTYAITGDIRDVWNCKSALSDQIIGEIRAVTAE